MRFSNKQKYSTSKLKKYRSIKKPSLAYNQRSDLIKHKKTKIRSTSLKTHNVRSVVSMRKKQLAFVDSASCRRNRYGFLHSRRNSKSTGGTKMFFGTDDVTVCKWLDSVKPDEKNKPLSINLSWSSITDDTLIKLADNFQRLEKIVLNDCMRITDIGIHALAKKCHGIREFDINIMAIKDSSIIELARHCHKTLTQITLNNTSITNASIVELSSCAKLKRIYLGNTSITDAALKHLAEKCPELFVISLNDCKQVTPSGICVFSKNCHKLSSCFLRNMESLDDTFMKEILSNGKRLQSLDLIGTNVTEKYQTILMAEEVTEYREFLNKKDYLNTADNVVLVIQGDESVDHNGAFEGGDLAFLDTFRSIRHVRVRKITVQNKTQLMAELNKIQNQSVLHLVIAAHGNPNNINLAKEVVLSKGRLNKSPIMKKLKELIAPTASVLLHACEAGKMGLPEGNFASEFSAYMPGHRIFAQNNAKIRCPLCQMLMPINEPTMPEDPPISTTKHLEVVYDIGTHQVYLRKSKSARRIGIAIGGEIMRNGLYVWQVQFTQNACNIWVGVADPTVSLDNQLEDAKHKNKMYVIDMFGNQLNHDKFAIIKWMRGKQTEWDNPESKLKKLFPTEKVFKEWMDRRLYDAKNSNYIQKRASKAPDTCAGVNDIIECRLNCDNNDINVTRLGLKDGDSIIKARTLQFYLKSTKGTIHHYKTISVPSKGDLIRTCMIEGTTKESVACIALKPANTKLKGNADWRWNRCSNTLELRGMNQMHLFQTPHAETCPPSELTVTQHLEDLLLLFLVTLDPIPLHHSYRKATISDEGGKIRQMIQQIYNVAMDFRKNHSFWDSESSYHSINTRMIHLTGRSVHAGTYTKNLGDLAEDCLKHIHSLVYYGKECSNITKDDFKSMKSMKEQSSPEKRILRLTKLLTTLHDPERGACIEGLIDSWRHHTFADKCQQLFGEKRDNTWSLAADAYTSLKEEACLDADNIFKNDGLERAKIRVSYAGDENKKKIALDNLKALRMNKFNNVWKEMSPQVVEMYKKDCGLDDTQVQKLTDSIKECKEYSDLDAVDDVVKTCKNVWTTT